MKALVFTNYSQPPSIQEVPIPISTKDETLVKVVYCGVNRIDLATLARRFGNTLPFPLILGSEIVGILPNGKRVAVNPYLHCGKCKNCRKGKLLGCLRGRPLIGIQRNGGYAKYVSVPKTNIVPIPDDISFQDVCAVLVSAGTAYRMVCTWAKINNGAFVVVTAAGGGVGIYSCQLAKLHGAKVIALAGND
ncbi:MAG TPA: alcohol dehydrogenase catalytic domain-containing protein, partial [Chryseolinea sp.]|nr:alcohol dehydrogenase catalytic domain-containing protein [Chryseolinea sp.]